MIVRRQQPARAMLSSVPTLLALSLAIPLLSLSPPPSYSAAPALVVVAATSIPRPPSSNNNGEPGSANRAWSSGFEGPRANFLETVLEGNVANQKSCKVSARDGGGGGGCVILLLPAPVSGCPPLRRARVEWASWTDTSTTNSIQPTSACEFIMTATQPLQPTGLIQDACCDYQTVEQVNDDISRQLNEIIQLPFFRYQKIDLFRECPFWNEDGSCMNRACAVQETDEVGVVPLGMLFVTSFPSVEYKSCATDTPGLNFPCTPHAKPGSHPGGLAIADAGKSEGGSAGGVHLVSALDALGRPGHGRGDFTRGRY